MCKHLTALTAAFFIVNSALGYADEKRCVSLFEKSLFEEALAECRSASIDGSTTARYYLGKLYLDGKGVEKNTDTALRLIRDAAQLGHKDAISELGKMHHAGGVAAKDPSKSCDWWQLLANTGDAQGFEKLGVCYLLGKGRKKDAAKGYAYLSIASEKGNEAAKYIIETYGSRFTEEQKNKAQNIMDTLR